MKATIYHGVGNISLEEIAKPTPGERDVLIKNIRSGICGTDVHAYLVEGESVGINPENQFGHEMVGVVEEVGAQVEGIVPGMRVFVNPTKVKPEGKGLSPNEIADMAGAFSEYIVVEEAALDYNLFLLPDDLSFDKAVITEPFSVAMHGVNLAHPKPGERALVYGGGVIGLCTLVALKSKGVEEVIVSDIKENRLAMIKELGGIPFDARTGNVIDFVKEKYGTLVGNMGEETIDVDIVIDAAGYNGVMEEFLANAKTLSRYVIVALNASNVPIVPLYVLAKELTILGSRGYTAQDIKEVIESLRSQENHLDKIITDVYPIEKVQEAFNKAIDAENAIKVVLAYE